MSLIFSQSEADSLGYFPCKQISQNRIKKITFLLLKDFDLENINKQQFQTLWLKVKCTTLFSRSKKKLIDWKSAKLEKSIRNLG